MSCTTKTAEGAAAAVQLPSREAMAQLQVDVRFPAAVKATAASMVELYKGNPILNRLLNDRARQVFGILVLDLHFFGGSGLGFTGSQARDFCIAHDVCSAGRAAAMIALMRFGGYLEALPVTADRRERRLGVTDKLIAVTRQRWQRLFTAFALVRAEGETALAALSQPGFVPALAHALAQDFRTGVRMLHSAPALGLFAERNSGIVVLLDLIAAAPGDDTVPPARPQPVSISGLAKRFGVSRAHVLKLLRDAAAEGFIALDSADGHRVTFQPKLSQAVRDFFAAAFLYVGGRAAAAARRIDGDDAPGEGR